MATDAFATFGKSQIREMQREARLRTRILSWHWLGLMIVLVACALALAACASGPVLVSHGFGFNVDQDSPNYEILAYKYGAGRAHTTSSDDSIRQFGKSRQGTNIYGPMPVGDSLYVRWRNKASSQVLEKTVDLKLLLPKDITNQEIYFVVGEGEVYVYLIDRVPRPKDWPIVGPSKFQYEKVRQLHP